MSPTQSLSWRQVHHTTRVPALGRRASARSRSSDSRAGAKRSLIRPTPNETAGDSTERLIDRAHRAGLERHLAVARLAASLVLVGVMQVGSDPLHSQAVTMLMAAYVCYAAVVFVLQWRFAMCTQRAAFVCHFTDFLWATAATALSGGTSSHTFMLFLLVVAAGAYRWSLWGSVASAGGVLVVASGEAFAAARGWVSWPLEFDTFALLPLSVVVFAVLFGLLAERVHALTAQAVAVGEVLRYAGAASNTAAAVEAALVQTLELFGAREAILAVLETDTDRTYLWSAQSQGSAEPAVTRRAVPRAERATWFFALPGAARTFEWQRRGEAAAMSVQILDGERIECRDSTEARNAPLSQEGRTLTMTLSEVPRCWTARLLLVDARRPRDLALRLPLLQRFVDQVTPALASLYLIHRLRTRAEERQRARLARELHDGVVQTLTALDMRIEMGSRKVQDSDPALWSELRQTRELVRADVARLRELMEGLRPNAIDARDLPLELSGLVERFARTTGIDAQLVWRASHSDFTPRQSEELIRIVQEALVNARRHSGASHLTIRVAADVSDWEVTVEDDGVGFPFVGRRTHAQLRDGNEGPRVMRERVEVLGGSLEIHSSRSGSRLEIVFPRALADA